MYTHCQTAVQSRSGEKRLKNGGGGGGSQLQTKKLITYKMWLFSLYLVIDMIFITRNLLLKK